MPTRIRSSALFVALMIVTLAGCREIADPLDADTQASFDASVQFLPIEGGCWTITTGPRVTYQPMSLPEEFRVDGLKVRVDAKRRDDLGSHCMVGPVIELISIRVR